MRSADWDTGFGRAVGVFLNGEGIQERDTRGEDVTDVDFLLYFSAADEAVRFTLPPTSYGASWDVVVDTAGKAADRSPVRAGTQLAVEGRSLVVLRQHHEAEVEPDHSVAASLAVLAGAQSTTTQAVPLAPAAR